MLNRFQQNRLRKAYDEPLTRAFLARRYSVSERTIARFWHDEQLAGRLTTAPRKHFAETTFRPPSATPSLDTIAPASDAAALDLIDVGRKIADLERAAVSFEDLNSRSTSASLEVMRRHHPELDDPAKHEAPAAWLIRDRDASLAPSHDQLRNMARKFDRKEYTA